MNYFIVPFFTFIYLDLKISVQSFSAEMIIRS